jgi:TusA-related sulfurtransferase
MKSKIFMLIFSLTAISVFHGFILAPANVKANEHHGAHVHGIARLNIALEEKTLFIEFISPAANITGFEYTPQIREDRNIVKKAIEQLKNGEKLFVLSKNAGAALSQSNVDAQQAADTGEDHHGQDMEESNDEKEGHSHHEHHSDFKAVYRFLCKKPEKLKSIDVMLFGLFKGIEKIQAQVLTPAGQTHVTLTPEEYRIDL